MRHDTRLRKKIRRSCIIAATAIVASRTNISSAVTVSEYYIDAQIATDPNFTTGVQNVVLSGSTPTVNVPIGDYFQFGVALVLSGNPNPAAGDAWDLANQAAGNPPQPANLGISQVRFDVPSTDASSYSLAPLLGPLNPNFAPGSGIHDSTAIINPDQSFDFESPGAVEGGGIVNINFANDSNINLRTAAVGELGYFSGIDAMPGQATPFFTNLAFQGQAAGSVQLSPGIEYDSTDGYELNYWTNQTPGSVAANGTLKSATYSFQNQLTAADTVNPLPMITINVTPTQPVLSLSSSSPPTTYGNNVPLINLLPTNGLNDAVSIQTPGTKFFVEVLDLDPATSYVTVYFAALEHNLRLGTTADIAQFIEDLDDNDEGIIVSPSNLVNSDYNVMFQIPQADFTQPNSLVYLGLDMTQISNIPDISNFFISQVLVVPEPSSTGLLIVGAVALIRRRRKRK